MLNTTNITLLDEYRAGSYYVYGLWSIDIGDELVEMAAAIGVPAYQIGTAKAAGSCRGLLDVWFNDPCDWSGQGGGQELTEEQRDMALDVLRGELSQLWEQYEEDEYEEDE